MRRAKEGFRVRARRARRHTADPFIVHISAAAAPRSPRSQAMDGANDLRGHVCSPGGRAHGWLAGRGGEGGQRRVMLAAASGIMGVGVSCARTAPGDGEKGSLGFHLVCDSAGLLSCRSNEGSGSFAAAGGWQASIVFVGGEVLGGRRGERACRRGCGLCAGGATGGQGTSARLQLCPAAARAPCWQVGRGRAVLPLGGGCGGAVVAGSRTVCACVWAADDFFRGRGGVWFGEVIPADFALFKCSRARECLCVSDEPRRVRGAMCCSTVVFLTARP